MLFLLVLFPACAAHSASSAEKNILVCFTPGENCTAKIVRAIAKAQKQILVQAYTFTSLPIGRALCQMQRRGVAVGILIDKSQLDQKFPIIDYFLKQNIFLRIDYLPAAAHNKVIVIDDNTVLTGSFNFTRAAEQNNAENLLIIRDPDLAKEYIRNWQRRMNKSVTVEKYQHLRSVKTNTAPEDVLSRL